MDRSIIFYSWQSDLPNNLNRGFIEDALEKAAKSIRNDDSIAIEPVIDRDTFGIPGSPDIASTIFSKINQAQIFVCDISIINPNASSRLTPNPNVLIELGYAIKTLGTERIIMVMNTSFGTPDKLPFDLRMKRVITYDADQEQTDKARERKLLEQKLESGLRTILEVERKQISALASDQINENNSISEKARIAIENAQPNRTVLARQFMNWLNDKLEQGAPQFPGIENTNEPDEVLVEALEETRELVIEFTQFAEIAAIQNDVEVCQGALKGFSPILNSYFPPTNDSGSYRTTQQDFYRFIGHELFTTFIAKLIEENRWELITNILNKGFSVENSARWGERSISFESFSYPVDLFRYRNRRLQKRRISIHSDTLHNRHSGKDVLSKAMPIDRFMDADFFLFLRSNQWAPHSTLYLTKLPRFLLESTSKKQADALLEPLGVSNIQELRQRIGEKKNFFMYLWGEPLLAGPLDDFQSQFIGSK